MDLSQVEMSNGVAVADTRRLGRQLLPVLLKHVAWNGSGLEDDQDFGRNVGRTWEFVKRLHTARRIKRLCPSRRQNAEVVALPEVVATWSSDDAPQCLSIAARRASRVGRRRLFAQRLRYSPRLGYRRRPDAATCGGRSRNALQNEGQGMSRLAENRQPRLCRGADWVPYAA